MWDLLGIAAEFLLPGLESNRRFYASLMLSAAIAGMISWLDPQTKGTTFCCIGVVCLGITAGIWWEYRNR
jgi:hypothetical protein